MWNISLWSEHKDEMGNRDKINITVSASSCQEARNIAEERYPGYFVEGYCPA